MIKGLEGIRGVEVGGMAAMPLAGMIMSTWGAEIIHVEPPGRGDFQRRLLELRASGKAQGSPINYLWEHVDRNKKSIAIDIGAPEGRNILYKLIASADVFLNNLRPYELEKFKLTYDLLSKINPRIIWANLTGYGLRGPEKNTGGYDSVAFWARSGAMDLVHDGDSPPQVSRPAYGDSSTSLSLLAGIMAALYIRERTGLGQEVEVSLYNTATYIMGFDISGCLATGEDAFRTDRRKVPNPIRNHYPTKDGRWIMLGMTNSEHYWPNFCQTMGRPEWKEDPRFVTAGARAKHGEELIAAIEEIFRSKTYEEWTGILGAGSLIWAPVMTALEVTRDEQARTNDFFIEWDHPQHGPFRMVNNPIRLSRTPAEIRRGAPDLGEHTDEVMKGLSYSPGEIARLRKAAVIG
jgi:crotonobetainyl-CoA:carnitine CoA-transferase CaiB-like acyl-CoA transferase